MNSLNLAIQMDQTTTQSTKLCEEAVGIYKTAIGILDAMIEEQGDVSEDVVKAMVLRAAIVGNIHGEGNFTYQKLTPPLGDGEVQHMVYSDVPGDWATKNWVVRLDGDKCQRIIDELLWWHPELTKPLDLMLRVIGLIQAAKALGLDPECKKRLLAYVYFSGYYPISQYTDETGCEHDEFLYRQWLLAKANSLIQKGLDEAFSVFMTKHHLL